LIQVPPVLLSHCEYLQVSFTRGGHTNLAPTLQRPSLHESPKGDIIFMNH
jgi:hypothetical protein